MIANNSVAFDTDELRKRREPILIQKYRNELSRTPLNDSEEDFVNSTQNLSVIRDVRNATNYIFFLCLFLFDFKDFHHFSI